MKNYFFVIQFSFVLALFVACSSTPNSKNKDVKIDSLTVSKSDSLASCSPNPKSNYAIERAQTGKIINTDLPIIGILMYNQVLTTELTAPMDVFTKHSKDGKQLFNVITIAENYQMIISEEGLRMLPDFTIADAPELDIIIVPSAYDMSAQVKNQQLVNYIKTQNKNTQFTVSNCAGASLLGASGVADGKKIVTWIGGGTDLQKNYPNLKVQDESQISYVEDGKFLSSNGNLVSYISSLELLEKLTSKAHRDYVESFLYLDRLQNWPQK